MKICFITTFFPGATLPFAQHLHEKGHQCDLYFFANQGRANIETLDFDVPIEGKELQRLSKENNIYIYLSKSIDVSIVPYYIVKNRKYLIGFISYFKNICIINKMLKELKAKKYDLIYIIANEEHDAIVAKELHRRGYKNVVIAYHEVLINHIGKPVLKKVVKSTINLKYPIICYSEHTKRTLLEQVKRCNLFDIPDINCLYFGPFETYKRFDVSTPMIKDSYILFIGSIKPYKGLSFLYDSLKGFGQDLSVKIVVAGSGYDSCIEEMKKDSRFIVINRFLSDEEFANLTCYATCIVCPYVSGSQSGITHTAMVYKTPLIATNVGAFPEFITESGNGYLVNYGDKEQLIEKIYHILHGYDRKKYSYPEAISWESIVSTFEKRFLFKDANIGIISEK